MKTHLQQLNISKINFFLASLLVFLIPMLGSNRILSPIIILWIFTYIIDGHFYAKFSLAKNKILFFSVLFFFFLHVVGMIYTSNFSSGLFDLEVKLSLLLFPLVMINVNKNYSRRFHFILSSFVVGCLISSFICLVTALLHSGLTDSSFFFYEKLTAVFSLHPSYFSMYSGFSILILLYFFYSERLKKYHFIFLICILFFLLMIYLLSSKAGIISIAMVSSIYMIFLLIKKTFQWNTIGLLILFLFFLIFAIKYNNRFGNLKQTSTQHAEKNTQTSESNAVRILILESTTYLIKQNILFGVGTGDIKDELMHEYQKRSMSGAYDHKLNVHNQFLETFLGQGLIGLLLLLFLFLFPLWVAVKKQNFIFAGFLFLTGVSFIFESMLNTQAGVIFFAFFYSFFAFVPLKENSSL